MGRGLQQQPSAKRRRKKKTHAHTHTRKHRNTQSEPAAIALKLCLHGRTGNSLVFVCVPASVCAQRTAFQQLNKLNIPVYTNACRKEESKWDHNLWLWRFVHSVGGAGSTLNPQKTSNVTAFSPWQSEIAVIHSSIALLWLL